MKNIGVLTAAGIGIGVVLAFLLAEVESRGGFSPEKLAIILLLVGTYTVVVIIMLQKEEKNWSGTIGIVAVTSFIYFISSNWQPYLSPLSTIDPFGVVSFNYAGAVSYLFMHVGLKHLIGNIIAIGILGYIVEKYLGTKHFLGIYFTSGIGAGILYTYFFPGSWVIGASAAITGILMAAAVVDLKKTMIAFLAIMIIIPGIVFPITDQGIDFLQQERIKEATELKAEAIEIEGELDEQQTIEEELLLQELLVQVQNREQEIEQQKVQVEKGRKTESVTPVSFEIHLLGIFLALAYMVVFKRDAFDMLDVQGQWLVKRWR